ncbi:MAG TPA: hypothetical protein VIK74_04075 [Parasegetibacter sp.]
MIEIDELQVSVYNSLNFTPEPFIENTIITAIYYLAIQTSALKAQDTLLSSFPEKYILSVQEKVTYSGPQSVYSRFPNSNKVTNTRWWEWLAFPVSFLWN